MKQNGSDWNILSNGGDFAYNRKAGVGILVLCILLSLRIGAGRTLSKAYDKVMDEFYDVTTVTNDNTSYNQNGIGGYLTERVDYAHQLVNIGSRYISSADSKITDVETARTALSALLEERSEDISAVYDANTALNDAVTALYDTLGAMSLSESDEKYRKGIYQDFKACNDSIGHETYNTDASAYNKKRNASILGFFSGEPEAELYQ